MTVNMLGSHHESRPSRTVAEWLWPFLPMGVSAFSLSALVYYHLRQNVFEVRSPLQQFYAGIYRTVGFAPAVMFFGLAILWSTIWLVVGRLDRPASRLLRLVAMAVMLGVFLNLGDGGVSPAVHKGALGAWFAETLVGAFGYWPSLLLVWAITFASLLLATDFFFHESFERLRVPPQPKEAGVEAVVTDHLRGLAGLTPSGPGTAPVVPGPAVPPAVAVDEPPAVATPGAPSAPAEAEPVVRRRSYAERRAEREARSWRRPADEDWVPEAPENQEIDNPETPAPAPGPAGVAGSDGAAEAARDLALPAAEPRPQGEGEDVQREVAAEPEPAPEAWAAAPAPPESAPSLRHQPIVFPDEVVPLPPPAADRFADERELRDEPEAFEPEPPEPEPAEPETEPATEPEEEPEPEPEEATARDRGDVEPIVAIPRPELPARPDIAAPAEPPARQQQLFGSQLDEALVQEAIEVVTGSRRASVTFLQRRLRIDYALASEILAELAARGVVELEGDATHGRVLG